MSIACIDDDRLASLDACSVMDTAREPLFDNLTFTVAQLFRTRVAGLILVGEERIWPKAEVGLVQSQWSSVSVFCRAVVETGEPVLVEDAGGDPRFGRFRSWEGALRFCVAAPVLGPNRQVIGALGAFDLIGRTVPHRPLAALWHLAEQASELLQLRVPGLCLEPS